MSRVPESLRKAAIDAFHAYEEVLIARIVRREGWRMDAPGKGFEPLINGADWIVSPASPMKRLP